MLPATKQPAAVGYLRVTADRSHARIADPQSQPDEGVSGEDRVAVDKDENVEPGLGDPAIERGRLTGVRLTDNADTRQAHSANDPGRVVGGSLVHDDHLELTRIVAGHHRPAGR